MDGELWWEKYFTGNEWYGDYILDHRDLFPALTAAVAELEAAGEVITRMRISALAHKLWREYTAELVPDPDCDYTFVCPATGDHKPFCYTRNPQWGFRREQWLGLERGDSPLFDRFDSQGGARGLFQVLAPAWGEDPAPKSKRRKRRK